MRRVLAVLAMAAAVAACPGPQGPEPDATPSVTPTPAPVATASATATSNGARAVAEETDDFLFEYSYPSEAGEIPELAALLDGRLARNREALAGEAVQARREARSNGFPYNKHSHASEWKLVADLPGWLSLSEDVSTYTGGAHGNYTRQSLVWDKQAGKALDGIALFASSAALEEALGDKFCDGLDRERAKRRGAPIAEDSAEQFDQCPALDELEVLVGSSNRRTFNRLTFYAGPYVAGPYAEGAYEVNVNVDRAILAAVRPEYREAFSARN
ncbi:MAG TPA: DUF4163 domain-containing protein [Croceibacterium sp.]